jgi:hypothetical protein
VVESPAAYSGKEILTKGVLVASEDSLAFYSPACLPSSTNSIGTTQGVISDSVKPAGLAKKLRRLFKKHAAVKVEAEGDFSSSGGPFGSDIASFRFVIRQLRSVEKK